MLSYLALAAITQTLITPVERDFTVANFRFDSGETLETLNLHCTTLGEPHRNEKSGKVDNAVLIMHGTGGLGRSLMVKSFSEVLFGPGQPLDASKYFLILPDAIGHGKSSKPSDGLHAKFPAYRYHDIVRAQHELVFGKLGVDHLRLVMGTSMGGMQTLLWGEEYPTDMDALMPLACAPIEIAGRNRMTRQMAIDAIRTDPEWMGGDYKTQPRGLTTAIYALILMGSSPLQMLKQAPTGDAARDLLRRSVQGRLATTDANDLLYQIEASQDYKPNANLEKIVVPLTMVNSADDYINPPELDVVRTEMKRVKKGKFVMLQTSDETRGHGTHTIAKLWKTHLEQLLRRSRS